MAFHSVLQRPLPAHLPSARPSLCHESIRKAYFSSHSVFAANQIHNVSAWYRLSYRRPNCNCFDVSATAEPIQANNAEVQQRLRVALICGGPSLERGISLNSARSVLDHIQAADVVVDCYYFDQHLQPYAISPSQMYSNTPLDFDFKLQSVAKTFDSLGEFMQHLQSSADIVFPVIHGYFGEDGQIQELLEKYNIPFVGTSSWSAQRAFDKYNAATDLSKHGFPTIPSLLLEGPIVDKGVLAEWFISHSLNTNSGHVVVKPARGGSSLGVSVAHGIDDAFTKAQILQTEYIHNRVVVEVYAEGGKEFTAIVLDTGTGDSVQPITLLPTEVEIHQNESQCGEDGSIFNYRRKYLPTRQVSYHTPPRFTLELVQEIRNGASKVFKLLGLSDFARIDGWVLPQAGGKVVFTDINLISGMEQTSFLFQQAAQVTCIIGRLDFRIRMCFYWFFGMHVHDIQCFTNLIQSIWGPKP